MQSNIGQTETQMDTPDRIHKSRLPGWLRTTLVGLGSLVFLFVALIGLACIAYANLPPFPSDAELIRRFDQNRPYFDQLVRMSKEDDAILRYVRVRKSWTPPEISKPRASEYMISLRKVGGLGLLSRDCDRGNVFLIVESKLNGNVKGFAYLRTRPRFVEASLDDWLPFGFWSFHQDPTISERGTAFRELGDGWYLWRELQFSD